MPQQRRRESATCTPRLAFGHVDELEGVPLSSDLRALARGATRQEKLAAMRELYAMGDTEGALVIAGSISRPSSRPSAPPELRDGAAAVDGTASIPVDVSIPIPIDVSLPLDHTLLQRPRTALALSTVARVVKSTAEISRLPIDHRAGFLLTCIEGSPTIDEILDVCAMPLREALELVLSLADLGIIELVERSARR